MQLRYSALLPKVACEMITVPITNYDNYFDRLHNGHIKLPMLSASACSKRLIILDFLSRFTFLAKETECNTINICFY